MWADSLMDAAVGIPSCSSEPGDGTLWPGFENVGGVVFSTTNTNELLIETAKQDLIPFHI